MARRQGQSAVFTDVLRRYFPATIGAISANERRAFCMSEKQKPAGTGARERWTEYTREYRKKNPERVLAWNLHSAQRLLERNGYTVIPPHGDRCPAHEERRI